MSARIGVAVMSAALLLYIVLVGQRAWLLLRSSEPIAVTMGVALVVLPLVAVWALGRELWFGFRAEQLAKRLENERGLPAESVAVRPSGRVLRDEADAIFPAYQSAVEASPASWQAWYRLALAYDAAGDRKRARAAVRTAVSLEGAQRRRRVG